MKVALAVVLLCVLAGSAESTCSPSACSSDGGNCTEYTRYINCMSDERTRCTTSQTQEVDGIMAAIAGATLEKIKLGCGGSMITVSMTTLAISLLVFYLQL